jgi:hypothetical protein
MSMDLDASEIAQRLAGLETAVPSLQMLVLFGSIGRGAATRFSDVDLAFLGDGLTPDELYLAIAPRLHTDRLDLADLLHAPPILAFAIAREGRLLYERMPGTFRSFQSLAWRRFCDTAKLREGTKRRIHRFLEREGLR